MSLNLPILSQLSVKIEVKSRKLSGSGFLYIPPSDIPYIYVLTAKHCLYGKKFTYRTNPKDVIVHFSNGDEPPSFNTYALTDADLIISDKANIPDLAALQIPRSALIDWDLPESYIAGYDSASIDVLFKGFPQLTGGKEARTVHLDVITTDSTDRLIRSETRTGFKGEDSVAEYNVEGFSGSGLCVAINDRYYLIGIVYEFEAATSRFHSCGIKDWLSKKITGAQLYDIPSERLLPFKKFERNVSDAIKLLGPRYSEDFTFPVPLLELEPSLAAGPAAKTKLISEVNKVFESLKKFKRAHLKMSYTGQLALQAAIFKKSDYGYLHSDQSFDQLAANFESLLNEILRLIRTGPFPEVDFKLIKKHGRRLYELGYTLSSAAYGFSSSNPGFDKNFGNVQMLASELGNVAETFLGRNSTTDFQLLRTRRLRLGGEAGSGKSHLLADIASLRIRAGLPTLLFLGQNFIKDQDPWKTINNTLDLPDNSDELLLLLNEKGRIIGQRILIFIDAINEGLGLTIWKKHMQSFLERFDGFPYVGLLISYRSSYEPVLFPNVDLHKRLCELTHNGFVGNEIDALNAFVKHYGIKRANLPVLNHEFSNPLFLKLLCVGLLTDPDYDPSRKIGIDRVFRYFINNVNEKLGKDFDYNHIKLNLVNKIVDNFTQRYIGASIEPIAYDETIILVQDIVRPFIEKRRFLDKLLDENVFIDVVDHQADRGIEFYVDYAYQRFGDIMVAKHLIASVSDYKRAFTPGGNIYTFFESIKNESSLQGLLEALAILWPTAFNDELHLSVLDVNRFSRPFSAAFLNSLAWRQVPPKPQTISDILRIFLNDHQDRRRIHYFWKTLLELSLDPSNSANAEYLHNLLLNMSLTERDAAWTTYLQTEYPFDELEPTAISRLLRWGWKANTDSFYQTELVILGATSMAWFLTSSNRGLRDMTTKALINLFAAHPTTIINWMKKFIVVNDPYVVERVYAVAFGAAVRWKNIDHLKDLSIFVYQNFFKVPEISPDILTRDYARQIIEFTRTKTDISDIDLALIRPPYGTGLSEIFPAREDLQRYVSPRASRADNDSNRGVQQIVSSMVVDQGMTTRYGDFGRYVFQSALRDWKVNAVDLSNLAVIWIMEKYGYKGSEVSEYDSRATSNADRMRHSHIERIGKKYQWIAFYEILARVSDSLPFYPNDWNQREKAQQYNGPWEPYVRDIDPTLLQNPFLKKSRFWLDPIEFIGSEQDNQSWSQTTTDLPLPTSLVSVRDDFHKEWIILEIHHELGDKSDGDAYFENEEKRIWIQVRSYLVEAPDYSNFTEPLANANFMNRWMPEYHSDYKVFNREYYWSPAFANVLKNQSIWREVEYNDEFIGMAAPTAQEFLWEEEFDNSKLDGAVNILKPSKLIYELLELSDGDRDGEFVDQNGEVVCFDPSVNYVAPPCLLVNKKILIEKLKDKRLNIFWTVLGEKQVLNSDFPSVSFSALVKRSRKGLEGEYHFFVAEHI